MDESIRSPRANAGAEAARRPLRVGLDLTARLPQATGVDNALEQLALALLRTAPEVELFFFVNRGDPVLSEFPSLDPHRRLSLCLRSRIVRLPFQQVGLPLLSRRLRIDVLHSPAFILPLVEHPGRRPAQVLTVHDTTFFSLAEMHNALRRSEPYRRAVTVSIRRADRIIVPSEWVRSELRSLFPALAPAHIHVTPWGVSPMFRPCADQEITAARRRLGIDRPYILHVGTLEPRKNLARLVRAYETLVSAGRSEDLVLAGRPGWGYRPILHEIRSRGLAERVHLPGFVDQELLPGLMSGARLCVYPSLHEGFGFPPLEAMACGVPTVAGRSSSLIENLEGAAELADPEDVAALAGAMQRMLVDETLRDRRRRQGLARVAQLDWNRTARLTLDCYNEAFRACGGLD